MAEYATASGPRGTGELPKGATCTRITITPAENGGYIAEHHYRQRESSKRGEPYAYIEPRSMIFASEEALAKHLKTAFKGGD